jgi:hypothetical protein
MRSPVITAQRATVNETQQIAAPGGGAHAVGVIAAAIKRKM